MPSACGRFNPVTAGVCSPITVGEEHTMIKKIIAGACVALVAVAGVKAAANYLNENY